MKFSLKRKTILMIMGIALTISVVTILFARQGVTDIIKQEYTNKSADLSETIAAVLDAEEVRQLRDAVMELYAQTSDRVSNEAWGTPAHEAYAAHFAPITEMPEFVDLQTRLRAIQDANRIDCVYLVWPDIENTHVVYLVDASWEGNCPPGTFDLFYDQDYKVISEPEQGFPPMITDTAEYGWHLSSAKPIHDADGEIVAYAGVDVDMNSIMGLRNRYLYVIAGVMVLTAVLISLACIVLVNRFIIRPVNILSEASEEYVALEGVEACHRFAGLRSHTGDEIEALANSMVKMDEDINDYISNLIATTRELVASRRHEEELDRIAKIDALTRVRNKRAYDEKAAQMDDAVAKGGVSAFGIAMIDLNDLKKINDTYGHDKGNLAIQQLCGLICNTFKHSPVFRIGGDEFAVVLEGHDLENAASLADSLVAEVKRRGADKSLDPWDRITAAIGYATYDPARDANVEAVFKRADGRMYAVKKRMKGK